MPDIDTMHCEAVKIVESMKVDIESMKVDTVIDIDIDLSWYPL